MGRYFELISVSQILLGGLCLVALSSSVEAGPKTVPPRSVEAGAAPAPAPVKSCKGQKDGTSCQSEEQKCVPGFPPPHKFVGECLMDKCECSQSLNPCKGHMGAWSTLSCQCEFPNEKKGTICWETWVCDGNGNCLKPKKNAE